LGGSWGWFVSLIFFKSFCWLDISSFKVNDMDVLMVCKVFKLVNDWAWINSDDVRANSSEWERSCFFIWKLYIVFTVFEKCLHWMLLWCLIFKLEISCCGIVDSKCVWSQPRINRSFFHLFFFKYQFNDSKVVQIVIRNSFWEEFVFE